MPLLSPPSAVQIDIAGDDLAPSIHGPSDAAPPALTRAGPSLFATGKIPKTALGAVIKGGIRSVVCLSEPHEAGYCDEAKMLARHQIDLHHAAVSQAGWTDIYVPKHLTVLDSVAQPSLVYCDSGLRAAALCMAHQATRSKLPENLQPRFVPLPLVGGGDVESGKGSGNNVFDSFGSNGDRNVMLESIMQEHFASHTLGSFVRDRVTMSSSAQPNLPSGTVRLPGVAFVVSGQLCQSDYASLSTLGVKTLANVVVEPVGGAAPAHVTIADSDAAPAAVAEKAGLRYVDLDLATNGCKAALVERVKGLAGPIVIQLSDGTSASLLGLDMNGTLQMAPAGYDAAQARGLPGAPEDLEKEAAADKPYTLKDWAVMVAVAVFMGVMFGVAMESGKVTLPVVIRQQFLFRRFIMLKMFLSAAGGGAFFLAGVSVVSPALFKDVRELFMSCGNGKGLIGVAFGAFLLGVGMALGGACPGMVLIQIGSGVENSGFTFLGGAIAAGVYGFTQPAFAPYLTAGTCRKVKIDDIPLLKGIEYWKLALALSMMMAVPIILLEVLAPWNSQGEIPQGLTPWTQAWPPILSGVIIGLMQVPAVLGLGDTLGSSSAYMTMMSMILVALPGGLKTGAAKHLEGFRTGPGNWWQVIYIAAAILGALACSKITGTYGMAKGVPVLHAVLGGFTMILGSRMASGCTSGHGLSGMALLSVQSIFAVPAMFAGGIVTAFAMQAGDPGFTESLLPGL
mmetsp:Transcript_4301/g.8429  ORF Transcript_4301/g.8429 Transcript_4301/m.8429 type:complete len:736 (-) Transcript_4301:163-2370(-)